MHPIAATLISPSFEFFKDIKALEEELTGQRLSLQNIENLQDKSMSEEKWPDNRHTFFSFLAKKLRVHGKDEELAKILDHLKHNGLVA